jgi:hypothetical protein
MKDNLFQHEDGTVIPLGRDTRLLTGRAIRELREADAETVFNTLRSLIAAGETADALLVVAQLCEWRDRDRDRFVNGHGLTR